MTSAESIGSRYENGSCASFLSAHLSLSDFGFGAFLDEFHDGGEVI